MSTAPDVTRLLSEAADHRPESAAALLEAVYAELRAIAQQRMNQERHNHTLQATALVHEAYLRLVGNNEMKWDSRGHFFVAAAEAMRRILVEHARARMRVKRGGPDRKKLDLGMADVASLAADDHPEEIVALDDAVRRLGEMEPRAAAVVRLRFFAGLTVAETAEALGVSPRTVELDWSFGRAWLFRTLAEGNAGSES